MKTLFRSKKGYKTLITIVVLVYIVMVFIIFFALFKMDKVNPDTENAAAFGSIGTEMELKTFLYTPSDIVPKEFGIPLGGAANYADLITITCADKTRTEYGIFKQSAESFFNPIYGTNWKLEVIRYTPHGTQEPTLQDIDSDPIGHDVPVKIIVNSREFQDLVQNSGDSVKQIDLPLFTLNMRQEGIASQVLPCLKEGSLVKLVLLTEPQTPTGSNSGGETVI